MLHRAKNAYSARKSLSSATKVTSLTGTLYCGASCLSTILSEVTVQPATYSLPHVPPGTACYDNYKYHFLSIAFTGLVLLNGVINGLNYT